MFSPTFPTSPPPNIMPPSHHHRLPYLAPVRSLSAMKTPTLLPDIAENSPPLEPTRTPSPHRPGLRSISVASFLSDGTVEIEGFGFDLDTISETGDDAASAFGDNSIYEDSLYDPEDNRRSATPDLSRRAERILANAKRKLDLCGQNLSRARNSLVLSPSATPTNFMPLDHVIRPNLLIRAESAEPIMQTRRWRHEFGPSLNNGPRYTYGRSNSADEGSAALPGGGVGLGTAHLRTSSESAVHSGLQNPRPIDGVKTPPGLAEGPREIERSATADVGRSNSTAQMRQLRDQMKELRGKITNLQQQNKTDSIRRRESFSSVHGGINLSTPSLQDIRESRELDMTRPVVEIETKKDSERDSWESLLPPGASSSGSSRSGTPTMRQEQVISPFSEPHEGRHDAFSYDSLLIGNNFIRNTASSTSTSTTFRPNSISSEVSAASTVLAAPPTLERKESMVSVSSYETAMEGSLPTNSPTISSAISPLSPGPSDAGTISSSGLPSPGLYMTSLRPNPNPRPPTVTPPVNADDGYHSAPHTPRVYQPLPPEINPPAPTPTLADSSWYRDSVATVREVPGPVVGISTSARDSSAMVLAGREGEMELRIGREDKYLVDGMIEVLGRICCQMETESAAGRRELRDRLRGAMRVLEGEEGELEMF